MGTIPGNKFALALVHIVHSTRAFGTCALSKTRPQNCPHGKIRHLIIYQLIPSLIATFNCEI